MNQSFEESYKDPLIENSLFQLPIEEIGPLFRFGNDGRTTNETQKIQKTNLAPEKKEVIQKDNMNKTNTEKFNDNNNMLKRKRKLGRRTNKEKENQKIRINKNLQLGENNFQEIVALQPSWRYRTDASVDRSCATWFAKRNELRCLKTLAYRNA